jgi:AcrR family transcriptional regulator
MSKAVKTSRRYDSTFRRQQAELTRLRVLDASRRLLATGTYSTLTIGEIAAEAGVAYQTVYAIFGTKVRLAEAIVESGFSHIPDALKLYDRMFESPQPEQWFRTASRATRQILEPCADLARFIRESGDPGLLAGYADRERTRHAALADSGLMERLLESGRLSPHLSPAEAVDVIWTLSGADVYNQLVLGQGWTPDRYEAWLGDTLIKTVLSH